MKTNPVRYFGSPYRTSRIMRFAQELANITGKGENDFLFIEPYSIGDAVHTLGLLPRFREIYCEPGQRIILLCQDRATGLNEIMPFADVVVGGKLSAYELALEYMASLTNGLSPQLPIVCAPDMHALGKIGRTGVSPLLAKRSIFFLEQHEPWQGPIISAPLRAATEQRLAALGLRRDEGLIIIPHCMSFNDLAPEFWQAAVLLLRERFPHLRLFTETTGGRPAIEGTEALELSLAELIPAVEHAGAALVVRSGLADILAHAQADIVSLAPPISHHKFPPPSLRQEEFLVRAWFPDTTIVDVAVRDLDLESLQALVAAFRGPPATPRLAEAS
jgi:hypothetical protein